MNSYIQNQLNEIRQVTMLSDAALHASIKPAARSCIDCHQYGGRILLVGKGGRAADSQLITGELASRFAFDRPRPTCNCINDRHINPHGNWQ